VLAAWVLGGSAVAVCCALLLASSAQAAWSAPQTIASSVVWQFSQPLVARDAAGDAVAVWERGARYPSKNRSTTIEAATRRAGGSWSKPVGLASGSPGPRRPEVAIDSRGDATVVWEQSAVDGTVRGCCGTRRRLARLTVETRSHPVLGNWARTVVLASRQVHASEEHEPSPQVAVDGSGAVTVAYHLPERNSKQINSREDVLLSLRRRGGRWRHPVVVSHTRNSYEIQLALDARGDTILAWDDGGLQGGGEHAPEWVEALVLARSHKPERPPQVLSSKSKHAGELDLAANSQGAAVLAWSRELAEGQGRGPVEAATRPAGGHFTMKPVTLARESSAAIVAIDQQGNATALFENSMPSGSDEESGPLEAISHPAGGGWSMPKPVAPKSAPQALAYGPQGELLALWGTQLPPVGAPEHLVAKGFIAASIQTTGGIWQPAVALTPENSLSASASAASAANGQATAVWIHEPSPSEELVETDDYEPA
jgi:hypothetical protein